MFILHHITLPNECEWAKAEGPMQRHDKAHWITAIIILLMLSLIPATSMAENGRDFAGLFSVTDVVGAANEVTVSLSLEIFNYSGADVSNATVRMEQLLPTDPLYESPTTIDIAYRDRAIVTEPVLVVPRLEYEQWLQGALPMVTIIYTDDSGNPRSTGVELVPMLLEGEVQP